MSAKILSPRRRIFRGALHVPVGALNVAAIFLHWAVGLIFCLGFLFYEANEDRHIEDQAWYDVAGYLWGIGLVVGVWLILNMRTP